MSTKHSRPSVGLVSHLLVRLLVRKDSAALEVLHSAAGSVGHGCQKRLPEPVPALSPRDAPSLLPPPVGLSCATSPDSCAGDEF